MKKKSLLILVILIVLCYAFISFVFIRDGFGIFRNIMEMNLSKETRDKIELVKNTANSDMYYPFKDKGKNYILVGYEIGEYNLNLEGSKMKIVKSRYKDGNLILELSIDIKIKRIKVPKGAISEYHYSEVLFDTIETKKDYNDVYIRVKGSNKEEYEIDRFNGGIVFKDKKYGYIDENANTILDTSYDYIKEFSRFETKDENGNRLKLDYSNYLMIRDDNRNGIATKQGDILIKCEYDNIILYGDNTFAVNKNVDGIDKTGVIDINNNIVIDFIDGSVTDEVFTSQKYACILNKKCGIIDRSFRVIVKPIYDDITFWEIDLSNSDGKYKKEYFNADNKYHEDYFVVRIGEKSAVMDSNGKIKIDYCDLSVYELKSLYAKEVVNQMKVK